MLIEPLRKVTSSSAVDGLLSYCRIPSERLFLQSLGMVIGIKAWCDDFKTMLSQDEESCYKHTKKLPSGSAPKTVLVSVTPSIPVSSVLLDSAIVLKWTESTQLFIYFFHFIY